MGRLKIVAMPQGTGGHCDWVARQTLQSLSRDHIHRQKHVSQMQSDIDTKRSQFLFADDLRSKQWPDASYMQPCVPTSSQFSRCSRAGRTTQEFAPAKDSRKYDAACQRYVVPQRAAALADAIRVQGTM